VYPWSQGKGHGLSSLGTGKSSMLPKRIVVLDTTVEQYLQSFTRNVKYISMFLYLYLAFFGKQSMKSIVVVTSSHGLDDNVPLAPNLLLQCLQQYHLTTCTAS
jgi:hypothetical protein